MNNCINISSPGITYLYREIDSQGSQEKIFKKYRIKIKCLPQGQVTINLPKEKVQRIFIAFIEAKNI